MTAGSRDTRSPDPLIGRIVGERYRVEALIGRGGMGAVYRATQLNLGRPVALKVMRGDSAPSAVERFRREALTVAQLKHPNIVAIYDYGVAPDAGAYLVTELLEGRSLRDEVKRRGRLEADDALDVMSQVCAAMHAAHAAGVVHRDLKPDNIFLELSHASRVAKVLDFGVAKLYDDAEDALTVLTRAGAVVGTPMYMSPEQCESRHVDGRADVYALGCVLYELLVGTPPFVADSVPAIIHRHVYDAPRPPRSLADGIPPYVDAAVMRALAKSPADRFQTAGELGEALRAAGPDAIARTVVGDTGTATLPAAATDSLRARQTAPPNNLPAAITSFVGRDSAIAEIRHLLASARLLTLVGPGGVGKTRLALAAASSLLDEFPDGIWLVELAATADPRLVPSAVAHALDVREEPGRAAVDTLVGALDRKRALIVLDNCEHAVSACATLAVALLRGCARLHVLATSREALGVVAEQLLPVSTLALPQLDGPCEPAALLGCESVRLFVDRAQAVKPQFQLTTQNVESVARLCHQLEGIPLAIELAAARVKVLSVEQILMRMIDRFRLLTSGDRAATARQQTLRATIGWSYDLLDEDERALFTQLSVFAGGCTIEAAEEVCERDVLDPLTRLVDKSLVIAGEQAAEARFGMLETVRQYASEKLREAGEEARLRAAHRRWCARLATEAEGNLAGPLQGEWLRRLEVEHNNICAALRSCAEEGEDAEMGLDLCWSLRVYWSTYGHAREGQRWIDAALERGAAVSAATRAKALSAAALMARALGEYERALACSEQCVALRRELGDLAGVAAALQGLVEAAHFLGERDRAGRAAEECLAIHRDLGDELGAASAIFFLGLLADGQDEYDRAAACYEETLATFRRLGDQRRVSLVLNNLGTIAMRRGRTDEAEPLLEESLAISRELGSKRTAVYSLAGLGDVALERGDYARAEALHRETLSECVALGDTDGIAAGFEGLARAAAGHGLGRRAMLLAGAASALREELRVVLPASERRGLERALSAIRQTLGPQEADRALAEGRAMPTDRAIEIAVTGEP